MLPKLSIRRQLTYHERFLREVVLSSAKLEVDTDVEAVTDSLKFLAENGTAAGDKTALAIAKIFTITDDKRIKTLCIDGLYKINRPAAKKELLALYQNRENDMYWRDLSLASLKKAYREEQKFRPLDIQIINRIAPE